MSQLWFWLLYQPVVNALIFLYRILGNNLGLAIVFLTVFVRLLAMPLMKPQLETSKKMQELAPQLEKLKRKYKNDKQKFAQSQLELYRKAGLNPAAGCLPQIIQFLVLIALYQAFAEVLRPDGVAVVEKLNQVLYPFLQLPSSVNLNLKFLWLDLGRPDVIKFSSLPNLPGIVLLLSTLLQYLSAKMMVPQARLGQQVAGQTQAKTDDFSSAMQTQMLYLFPLMTLLIGFTFPSGLVLYWLVFSFVSVLQQYLISGWGGLEPIVDKLGLRGKKT
jgi:YidC/Oxa1 family membrane protein insertase